MTIQISATYKAARYLKAMMRVRGILSAILLDVETTGLDTANDRITELAAIRVEDDWKVTASFSTLVWDRHYPPLTPEVSKLTGITAEMLRKQFLRRLRSKD